MRDDRAPQDMQTLADTLLLRADGTGTRTAVSNARDVATDVVTPTVLRVAFTHTRTGDRVTLSNFECGVGCAASPPSASYTIRGDALESLGLTGRSRHERRSP